MSDNFVETRLGKVAMTPKGAWDISLSYELLDLVAHQGSSYIALKEVPAGTAITNLSYWMKIAERGGESNIDDSAGPGDYTSVWSANKSYTEIYGLIDDTAGEDDTDKVWSASKSTSVLKDMLMKGHVLYLFPSLSAEALAEESAPFNSVCALIVTPTKTIMMDGGMGPAGNGYTSDKSDWAAYRDYFDKLYQDGVFTNIDFIFISHYHGDHVFALDKLLERYPHNNCHAYIPLPAGDNIDSNITTKNFVITTLELHNVEYTVVDTDTVVDIDVHDGVVYSDMTLLNSTPEDVAYYDSSSPRFYNNYSMVSIFRHDKIYAMFPGDLQRTGEIRLMEQHGDSLPHVWLYVVNHHNEQIDDYLPFLEKIKPEYGIIMQYSYEIYSNYTGFSMERCLLYNICGSNISSTAYSSCEYVSANNIGKQISKKNTGFRYNKNFSNNIYVDNSYTGLIHDGTEEHPFLQITEALNFVKDVTDCTIFVKGTTKAYTSINVCNFIDKWLNIEGYKDAGGANVFPSIPYINIKNSNFVVVRKFNIVGGDNITVPLTINKSTAQINDNNISNANYTGTGDTIGIRLENSTIWCYYNTIGNTKYGINSSGFSEVFTYGNTYSNITGACIGNGRMKLHLYNIDTLSNNVSTYVNSGNDALPFELGVGQSLSSSIVSKFNNKSISAPFYYSATYPVAIIANSKLYNLLNGSEISL